MAPPTSKTLTTVQLLDAEMHFLSSHHWQPRVLAVQLAQSEKRKHCSSDASGGGGGWEGGWGGGGGRGGEA